MYAVPGLPPSGAPSMCLALAAPHRVGWVGCVRVQTTDQMGGTDLNAIPHTREGRGPVVVGSRVTRRLPGQRANGAPVLPETEPAAQSPGLGPVAPVTFTRMAVLGARRVGPTHLRQTSTAPAGRLTVEGGLSVGPAGAESLTIGRRLRLLLLRQQVLYPPIGAQVRLRVQVRCQDDLLLALIAARDAA